MFPRFAFTRRLAQGVAWLCVLSLPAYAAPAATAGKKLSVLTSFFPAYCLAANIAGASADVQNLLPPNAGPHDYQLSPSDLRKLKNAQILVVNGLGLEEWVKKAVAAAGNELVVVEMAGGLDDRLIDSNHQPRLGAERKPSSKRRGYPNPHIWLDPTMAAHAATNILRALQKADPERAAAYGANANALTERLNMMDQEIRQKTGPVAHQPFVTFHNAFPYFTKRYGLNLVGVLEDMPDVRRSPKSLSKLLGVMREQGVRVIFTEPQYSPQLAKQIAQDLKIRVAELDTLETGPVDAAAYEKGMRRNLETLTSALGAGK